MAISKQHGQSINKDIHRIVLGEVVDVEVHGESCRSYRETNKYDTPHEKANLVVEKVVVACDGVAKKSGCGGLVGSSDRNVDRVTWRIERYLLL